MRSLSEHRRGPLKFGGSGIKLGKMFVSMKVFPSDVDIDLEKLKERIKQAIPESASMRKIQEEPVAFGLVALILHIVVPEEESGIMDLLEDRIKSVEGVSQVETLAMGRI